MDRTRDLASLAGEETIFGGFAAEKLKRLQAELEPLSRRYDVVVANPPYMGSKNMNKWLGDWIKTHYKDVKGDLFSCFMVRNVGMGAEHAQLGFMTPYVWMFIGTYEKLRKFVIQQNTITSLIQLEYSGFSGATVPICTFTVQKGYCPGYRGGYVRLSDFVGVDQQAPRALEALANPDCGWFYKRSADTFEAIPGSPLGYWVGNGIWEKYKSNPNFSQVGHPKVGMQTSNNDRYLRLWWEVKYSEFVLPSENPIWIKYLKGGDYRKWYGNLEYLLHFKRDPSYILQQPHAKVLNLDLLNKPKCTWTDLTSGEPSFRYAPNDTFYDISGHCFFPSSDDQLYLLAYANTSLVALLKKVFNSSFHFQCGDLGKIVVPLVDAPTKNRVKRIAAIQIELSRADWDGFETSWDFKRHPLV